LPTKTYSPIKDAILMSLRWRENRCPTAIARYMDATRSTINERNTMQNSAIRTSISGCFIMPRKISDQKEN
jgi:hypothetical protein